MPAGQRGTGWHHIFLVLIGALRAQQEPRHTVLFGGELQTPPGNRWDFIGFADNSGDPGAAEPFFHCPQDIGIAFALDQDQPVGINAKFRQTMATEITAMLTPEDRRLRLCHQFMDQRRGKANRRRITKNLVQPRHRQPAPRQRLINFRIAEGDSRLTLVL